MSQPASWPGEYEEVASALREHLTGLATRIDHIGSTSVPGLPGKDVIDVMITVPDGDALALACARLAKAGHSVKSTPETILSGTKSTKRSGIRGSWLSARVNAGRTFTSGSRGAPNRSAGSTF